VSAFQLQPVLADSLRYTDVHYYFTQPTTRPLLHRFDKASYFYIYYNSTNRTTRLEIANNPGSHEQDAFSGRMESRIRLNTTDQRQASTDAASSIPAGSQPS